MTKSTLFHLVSQLKRGSMLSGIEAISYFTFRITAPPYQPLLGRSWDSMPALACKIELTLPCSSGVAQRRLTPRLIKPNRTFDAGVRTWTEIPLERSYV